MDASKKIDFLNNVVQMLPDCLSIEVKHFVASQFALESDFGQSPMALCNNNFCGMKVPALRVTLATNLEDKGMFAVFHGIYSCICDYLLWLSANKFSRYELQHLEGFIDHLSLSGYCPDKDYISRINQIYIQYYD